MSFNFLVVDDTNFMRKMAADCLRQYGHVVVGEAANGREAIAKYGELKPDIVMMDITMPEMNGIDAIKEILKIDPAAVILICSASNQQDMIVDALEIGAKGYLMKPFKPDRLNEIISKYAVPHLVAKKEEESDVQEQVEEVIKEEHSFINKDYVRTYNDDTSSIYGAEEEEEEDILEEDEVVVEEPEATEESRFEEVVDEPVVEMEVVEETFLEEKVIDAEDEIDEEQAVEYAEELLAKFGTEIQETEEVYLELDEEESPRPVVSLASKPVGQKTYQFPVSRQPINFVTSYMCSWQEEVNDEANHYSFTCSEEDNKISIEVINGKNEKQKVELSLDGFRQLFTWMEDRFEEGSKHKAVGLK